VSEAVFTGIGSGGPPEGGSHRAGLMPCIVAIASLVDDSICRRGDPAGSAARKAIRPNPQAQTRNGPGSAEPRKLCAALAAYRPQIGASLSAGLQAVRNLAPTIPVAERTLRP